MKLAILALALCAATPSLADIRIDFDEGAPKDRFTITNVGGCSLEAMGVTLDISTSPSGLIFDVTGSGAGVEVFQPFELTSGASLLVTEPRVTDGQQSILLNLSGLGKDQSIAFTIDVDDTTSDRQITVSGSEIAGAEVRVDMSGETSVGVFGSDAVSRVDLTACVS